MAVSSAPSCSPACDELGGELVITLGALLADSPHTRRDPGHGHRQLSPSWSTGSSASSRRTNGPTGIVGISRCPHAARHPGGVLLGGGPALRRPAAVTREATLALIGQIEGLLEVSIPLGATCARRRGVGSASVDELAQEDEHRRLRPRPGGDAATPPTCRRPPARRSPGSSSATSSAAGATTKTDRRAIADFRVSRPAVSPCGNAVRPRTLYLGWNMVPHPDRPLDARREDPRAGFAERPPRCTEELTAALRERILVVDGAMGTAIQRDRPDEAGYRGERFADWPSDLSGNNDLLTLTQPDIIAGDPPRVPRGRRRHHRDQHVQRQRHLAVRLRHGGARLRAQLRGGPAGPRGVRRGRPTARPSGRATWPAPSARPRAPRRSRPT